MGKTQTFLGERLWPRLSELSRTRGRRLIAVPFIGSGAARRIPLRDKDLLVTRFDEVSVKSGLVDPREILKYLRRGVEVHAVANLHAKVYVFGRRAVVGSANISESSATTLLEAGIESAAPSVVRRCAGFVESLCGDPVGPEYAKRLVPLYRPPRHLLGLRRRSSRQRTASHSALLCTVMSYISFDEADERAEASVHEEARHKLSDPGLFRLEEYRRHGRGLERFRVGRRLLVVFEHGRRRVVEPPARIVATRHYSAHGRKRIMIAVEVPKRLRPKALKVVVARLGSPGALLSRVKDLRLITDARLIYQVGQLWRSAAER